MESRITIEATIKAPLEKVWNYYNQAEHIVNWNFATDDWYCPKSEVDFRPGGKFLSTMAAKDGSFSFDFWGIYDSISLFKNVAYTMGDGRKASIDFSSLEHATLVTLAFEPEDQNSEDMQKTGWQSILNNFKNYVESN